jgi:polysaccharide biosynthesis protein PslJ
MTTYAQTPAGRRGVALTLACVGLLALTVSIPFGPRATIGGAVVLLLACLLALRDISVPVFTWPNVTAALILLVWLVPIKTYALPIDLPFNLEPYRLFLLMLIFAWLVGLIVGRSHLAADRQARVLLFLAAVLFATQIVNFEDVNAGSTEPEALKSLSYFLSFIIAFLLVTSTIESLPELDKLVHMLAAGAGVVALFALYDSRAGYNVFDHLHEWIPVLDYHPREVVEERGGRLRVYGSAQHPIALSVALLMAAPMAVYLARRASTVTRSRLWIGVALLCAAGALATVSRTTMVMAVAMVLLALWLRRKAVLRFWPILIVLPVVVHFAAPGALGGLYKSFFPKEGLVASLEGRAGETGSGRFADYGPGLEIWSRSPLIGTGIGEQTVPSDLPPGAVSGAAAADLTFDNQYLNTLVTTGILGLAAVLWFVWGSVVKLARAARRRVGQPSDLLAACSIAAVGFAASMAVFDAFYFVQCTLFFFMIVAIAFRARSLSQAKAEAPTG